MTGIETTLASTAIKAASGPATSALVKWGRRKYDRFIAAYTNALSEYITDSIQHCSTVKNILYKRQLASTKEKYVNVSFMGPKGEVNDSNILSALLHNRSILIRGRGGAGKTMFTKWAILSLCETIENHQRIPIFIELRDINTDHIYNNLEELIFGKISNNRKTTNFGQFLEGLKEGLFIIVLDAADEIKKASRKRILKMIDEFSRIFPETGILLTSREFNELNGMANFESFETQPLTLDQSLEILTKLDYVQNVKDDLIGDIKEGNYKKHSFFLENPLLVTILLLTFDQSREIPNKRSAFYKRAFETLYERHDSSKEGGYSRDLHAGLPMDDFESVFSLFCYGTYINSVFDFSETELVSNFGAALRELGFDDSASLVAKDAEESACLIVQEGHDFVFVHRSFQEYFAALYIKNYKESDIDQIIAESLEHSQGENILEFLYELDKFSLEKNYILPRLRKINNEFSKLDFHKPEDQIKGLGYFFAKLRIMEPSGTLYGLRLGKKIDNVFLMSIANIYPEADTFQLFSSEGIAQSFFRSLPLAKIAASRGMKVVSGVGKERILEVRFEPSSADWVFETSLPDRLRLVVDDLKKLETNLSKKYDAGKSKVSTRFRSFARDD